MTRIALSSTFTTPGTSDDARAVVLRHLSRTGLRLVDGEPSTITADGGSQLVARVLGIWFAYADAYPRRVRITIADTPTGTRVDVTIEETLGFGYLDKRSRRNYLAAFQTWLTGFGEAVDGALSVSS